MYSFSSNLIKLSNIAVTELNWIHNQAPIKFQAPSNEYIPITIKKLH